MILGAHGRPGEAGLHSAPRLALPDIEDLVAALIAIRDRLLAPVFGNPDTYRVNRHLSLLVGPEAYDGWRA